MVGAVGAALLFGDPVSAVMVNSKHDFTDNGFTGGGVCAECHVPHNAREIRIYPRDIGAVGTVDGTVLLLCKDCHKDASPSLPTGTGWSGVTGVTPPAYPHVAITGYDNCTRCHSHTAAEPFGPPPNDDCLTCHKASGVSTIDIDRLFAGIGTNTAPTPAILSQHNIYYVTDGNTATNEPFWPAGAGGNANECKKCHGDRAADGQVLKHPSPTVKLETSGARTGQLRSAFLVASDANGWARTPIATYAYGRQNVDKRLYEPFCLTCHQGAVRASTLASQKLGGALGAQQVGPTDRTNPANQQAAPTPPGTGWLVPAVPPKNEKVVGFTNPDPDGTAGRPWYFAYYSQNGHGAATALISANAMDQTCLSGGTNASGGCHLPHGSQSRFLLDDRGAAIGMFAPGIRTPSAVGTGVCLSANCHVVGVSMGVATGSFHGWWGNGSVLHDNSPLGGIGFPPARDGMGQWSKYGKGNMDINDSTTTPTAPALVGVLPFYADPGVATGGANELHRRTYPATPTVLTNANWFSCLTCHDLHGTGPATEPAMERRFDNSMSYTSPLCGECHTVDLP